MATWWMKTSQSVPRAASSRTYTAIMSQLQLVTVCAVIGLIGSARAALFSVGHINAVGNTGQLRFANVLADDLRGWQYDRGYYVVREIGYYYISFHGLSRHDEPLTLAVFRNNEELIAGYGSGNDYSTASNSGLFYLNINDIISLRIISGLTHEASNPLRNYVTLSGFSIGSGSGGGGFGLPPPVPAVAPVSPLSPAVLPAATLGGGLVTQPGGIGIVSKRSPFPLTPSVLAAGAADVFSPLIAGVGGPI